MRDHIRFEHFSAETNKTAGADLRPPPELVRCCLPSRLGGYTLFHGHFCRNDVWRHEAKNLGLVKGLGRVAEQSSE